MLCVCVLRCSEMVLFVYTDPSGPQGPGPSVGRMDGKRDRTNRTYRMDGSMQQTNRTDGWLDE